MKPIGVGIYGANGHQVHHLFMGNPRARLVATAAFPRESLPSPLKESASVHHYPTLDALLADARVDLVSLCSPRRRAQAADALRCLKAGKHVYAEKPCAMEEADLDAILRVSSETGKQFHEMAGSAFEQPYLAMRELIRQGRLGTVVQVFAQKSYPYFEKRPQDEDIDGGLIGQNSIHAVRFVEHVAGVKIAAVAAVETGLGNPQGGGLRMAATLMLRFENGGVGAVIANYLNPHTAFGSWGNEHLRIFGTRGFVESIDAGKKTRLVLADKDHGPLDTSAHSLSYFDLYLDALLGNGTMPLSIEDELHPTRIVIRAKARAAANAG